MWWPSQQDGSEPGPVEQINKIAIHISSLSANLAIGKITAGGRVHMVLGLARMLWNDSS
jgi:hypothetical protein